MKKTIPTNSNYLLFIALLSLLSFPNIVLAHWMPSTEYLLGGLALTLLVFWLLWFVIWKIIKKYVRLKRGNIIEYEVKEIPEIMENDVTLTASNGFGLNNLRRLHLFLSFMLVLYLFFTLAELFPAPTPWDRIPWYQGSLVMFAFWLRILMYALVSLGLALTARGFQLKSYKWGYRGGLLLSVICLFNTVIVYFAYKGGINWFFLIFGVFILIFMKKYKDEFQPKSR